MSTAARLDPERRAALRKAKLGALVRNNWGEEQAELGGFPGGATARAANRGWFHADERPARALGPALAWARQQELTELHVLVDDEQAAGILARRAGFFTDGPDVQVVDGRGVRPIPPSDYPEVRGTPSDIETLVELLRQAEVDVVVEHGEVIGEISGLEIARVAFDADGPRLEVGVGRHDREAFAMVHGELPTVEALRSVTTTVRRHRRADGPAHPLRRLAAERWLRARLIEWPELVEARRLVAIEPVEPRPGLKEAVPAGALGEDVEDRAVLVVTSVGVDLDLVPVAADLRERERRRGRKVDRLALVLPARDDHPVTGALADRLRETAEVVPLREEWRA